RISAETVDLLISNNIFNQKQLSTLTNTLSVLSSSSFPLQFMRVSEILKKFEAGSFQSVKTVFEKDPHSGIRLEPLKNDAIVNVNEDYLNLALEELLINSAKYASPKSRIHIYSYQKDGFIFLSVKNSVNSEEEGVPEESEKLVIEPFYRLSKTAEDIYIEYDEKYSTGLGLCVVNYIVKKHYGLFWIKNHKDHFSSGSGICTIAEIGLPIERAA
ncbi:MAG TPA: ATP-binding protein, partial [Leptospiraceae bacterium]|nr:ATP-binding protein [Leptospiraceae bacterium]